MLIYITVFLINSFHHSAVFDSILVLAFLIMAALSFSETKKINRQVALALFAAGASILIWRRADYSQWCGAVVENAGILTMVLSAPMMAVCLYYNRFDIAIQSLADRWMKKRMTFYCIMVVLSSSVSMLLNLAAIPLLHHLLDKARRDFPKSSYFKAFTRGFYIHAFWSPNYISIAVVLNYMNLQLNSIIGWGMLISLCGLTLSLLMERIRLYRTSDEACTAPQSESEPEPLNCGRELFLLALIIAYVVAAILIVERITGKGVTVAVPVVSLLAPLILALPLRKASVYRAHFSGYLKNTLPGINKEIYLFSSAGFLAYSLKRADLGPYIVEFLNRLGLNDTWLIVVTLIAVIGLPSLVGIHPIIMISAVASIFSSGGLALSELQLALTMLSGYLVYSMLSPFSSGLMILSNLSGESTVYLGLKSNWLYVLILTLLSVIMISLL